MMGVVVGMYWVLVIVYIMLFLNVFSMYNSSYIISRNFVNIMYIIVWMIIDYSKFICSGFVYL